MEDGLLVRSQCDAIACGVCLAFETAADMDGLEIALAACTAAIIEV